MILRSMLTVRAVVALTYAICPFLLHITPYVTFDMHVTPEHGVYDATVVYVLVKKVRPGFNA